MKISVSQLIVAAVLLQFSHVDAAGSCMVDGEVFNYCSNDLDGAWSFENGAVCVTEAECKKMTPPNGPIVPATTPPPTTTRAPTPPPSTTRAPTPPPSTTRTPTPPPTTTRTPTPPPTTTTKPPATPTPTPNSTKPAQCTYDGEVFPVCKDSDIWGFENGTVCIGVKDCPSTPSSTPTTTATTKPPTTTTKPPTTTTKPPTTPTPTKPTQCTYDGEVFPVCKDSDVWSFENNTVCIGAKDCPSTPSSTPTPTTTTKSPTTPTPSGPSSCTFNGEVFPVCKATSDPWGFENGGICIGLSQCENTTTPRPTTTTPRPPTPPPTTTTRSPTPPPTTTTPRPPTSPPSSGTAALYAQCGGNGYTGPTTCVSGARCNKQSDFYSQCVPDGSSTGGGGAALWAQCGGNGYTGPTTCVSGARCNKQSDFYSQCVPA